MLSTTCGRNSVASRMENQKVFPGNSKRENPYAVTTLATTAPTTFGMTILKVLIR